MGKIRVFLALNLSGEEKEILKQDQDAVKQKLGSIKVKWEEPAKFHLTLRFLGDIQEEKINPLFETLDRLKFDFEELVYETGSIGFFPNSKYPNVVFGGLNEISGSTNQLVELIDRIILNFGVKPDKRFIPHITLGRFSRDKRVRINEEIKHTLIKQVITFDSFYIMKSTLTPKGSVYETINKINFRK